METLLQALSAMRVPLQYDEYNLHRLTMEALDRAGIAYQHEVSLAPRCRIDLLCGDIGVEIKRGKPEHGRLLRQLQRYAACEQIRGLILISEKSTSLPASIAGKPVRGLCLNRLWGIAL